MKCEKAIEAYLESEDVTRIPLRARIHAFFCPVCSAEIYVLIAVFQSFESRPLWRTDRNITGTSMDSIRREKVYSEKRISGFNWILIGLIIFASILMINFSESFQWLKEQFGAGFVIPFSIVLGSMLTLYLMILTISNYEHLEKYLNLIYKGRGKF